jgi:lipopolysaccharide transport system ATP-binding protein
MIPGRIVADRVSRTFRVYPKAQRTLKDVFVARGRLRAREVQALRDVSLTIEPGEAVGLVGRNGSGKSTLLRIVSGIIKPTSGRIEAGGRIASLLELGAGFHPDFTGRENVYLNGSIHGLSRTRVREAMDEIVAFAELEQFIDLPVRTYSSGMYMRLGFSVAAHIESDVLLLDEVFAVGDEQFQRKCFGKIAEFKRRGGTIIFVSHDAQAVERLCDRAVLLRKGEVAFDGPTQEAIAAYRRLLAADANPEELEAGLREWGSGEARILSAQLVDATGEERSQFAGGEAVTLRIVVAADATVAAPRVALELRDDGGLVLASASRDTAELGWDGGAGERELRFHVPHLPLADGRFHVRVALTDAVNGHPLHALDDALRLHVFPAGDATGAVLLEGSWTMEETGAGAPIPRA